MDIKDILESYKLINGGQSTSVVLPQNEIIEENPNNVIDNEQLVKLYKQLNLLSKVDDEFLLDDIIRMLRIENDNSLNFQDMTYEKAVELGLNPEGFPKEAFEEIAQQHRDELSTEFANSYLYYYNPSYTVDEFLFNYLKNVEAGLADATKFNSTIGYGYLPSLMITPQDYIDWQNSIYAERGQFNGNLVEYLYVKIDALEKRVAELENK